MRAARMAGAGAENGSRLRYIGGHSKEIAGMTATVQVQIDEALNSKAAAVLAGMGLSVADVVRATLDRIASDKAVPFEMRASRSAPPAKKGGLDGFFHALDGKRSAGKTLSIEEMNAIAAAGWAGELDGKA